MADISQVKLPNGDIYDIKDDGASTATNWVNGSATNSVRTTGSAAERSGYTMGTGAVAEGYGTEARGNYSHAEGSGSVARGESSHVEGTGTTANGLASHAEGQGTTASAGAHAEGASTTASGQNSHAEGAGTRATNDYSHAEGASTLASGSVSHAEGSGTIASGSVSHAEGQSTTASGLVSHAEGSDSVASGTISHAEGTSTTASGLASHVEGSNTIANHMAQHVFGVYNIADSSAAASTLPGNYIEIVGNGTGTSARSNARTLDWSGNEVLAGKLTVGINPTANMDVVTKQYMENQGYLTDVEVDGSSVVNNGIAEIDLTGKSDVGHTHVVANITDFPSIPENTSDLNNDSGYITGMYIAAYGHTTWQEFITAYQAQKIVYCRASSNSNPASGSQTRLAFMAYVNNADNPTEVEFQYYRSVSSHTASQQGDQVYVYKLNKTNGWSVTVREAGTKLIVSTGLSTTYTTGTSASNTIKVKLNSETSLGTIGTTDNLHAVGVDSNGKLCVSVAGGGGSGSVTSVGLSNATDGGLTISGSPVTSSGTITVGHSNVLSNAQTTQAVYPITIDKNGHISGYGSAVNMTSTTTATLTTTGWSSNTQTVSVSGITASSIVIVSPTSTSYDDYCNTGVYCNAQGAGTLTFTCKTVPSSSLTVNVLYQ